MAQGCASAIACAQNPHSPLSWTLPILSRLWRRLRGAGDASCSADLRCSCVQHALCGPHQCGRNGRSEEHTSELQSLMRISYAVFCLKKKKTSHQYKQSTQKYLD